MLDEGRENTNEKINALNLMGMKKKEKNSINVHIHEVDFCEA